MSNFAKQTEIIFLWDGENWNPNGDMLNNNAPRYDEISHKALISDVRVKRTIRDDLSERKDFQIFVKETAAEGGGINDGKERVKSFGEGKDDIVEIIKEKCIDVRAFGGVFPVEKKQYNLTGALQFKMSKSIHKLNEPTFIKGTGAFASEKGKENKTFREEYILPYAMFATYGIVSERSAEISKFTEEDLTQVLDSLWVGTKNLITRSKVGQMPRFLLTITYKTPGFFIGDLNNRIKLKNLKPASETELRGIEDFTADLSEIGDLIKKNSDSIERIEYKIDDNFNTIIDSDWKEINIG